MSRAPVNIDLSDIGRPMDIMTSIDPSRLRMPYKSNSSKAGRQDTVLLRTCPSPVIFGVNEESHSERQLQASGEVTLEIKKSEAQVATGQSEPVVYSIPGWYIAFGYIFFSLSLALSNLFFKGSVLQPVCLLLSPSAMLGLSGHACTVQPPVYGLGLFSSAWLVPVACVSGLGLSVWFLAFLGISIAVAYRRLSALLCLAPLFVFLFLSLPVTVAAHGVEARWGVSVSVFLVTLLAVACTRHLARVSFKIRLLS